MRAMFPFTYVVYVIVQLMSTTSAITVRTHVGSITGIQEDVIIDGQTKTISKFWSIPFAETTAGVNRFAKPTPKASFTSTFQATKYPEACIQYSKLSEIQYAQKLNYTEDCLVLNVYVPHDFRQNVISLPVMVWIHGGAFVQGASALFQAEGLSGFGDVVLVTINYRLGMFGFLRSADGQLPGNQGLWDQQLAIKWVHENIAAFTGNPGDVTLFGESAGAASVLFQALYPGNKGFFHRVIAESGSPLAFWATLPGPNADQIIYATGCEKDSLSSIDCIRSKTIDQLQINGFLLFNETFTFRPIFDGDFLVATPHEIIFGNETKGAAARDFFASLDIVVGVNNYDGSFYYSSVLAMEMGQLVTMNSLTVTRDIYVNDIIPHVVKDLVQSDGTKQQQQLFEKLLIFEYTDWTQSGNSDLLRLSVLDMASDAMFFYPAVVLAQGHVRLNKGSTYFYQFSVDRTVNRQFTPFWLQGASHADDVDFVFGYPLYNNRVVTQNTFSPDEQNVARAVMTMWTNFAKTSNPNVPSDVTAYSSEAWPLYDMESQRYVDITNKMISVKERFQARRMQLWSSLIPVKKTTNTDQGLDNGQPRSSTMRALTGDAFFGK